VNNLSVKALPIALIRYYQRNTINKSTDGVCLYTPTCSTYMIIAIEKYGTVVGIYKGLKRISKCRPPNGGLDYP